MLYRGEWCASYISWWHVVTSPWHVPCGPYGDQMCIFCWSSTTSGLCATCRRELRMVDTTVIAGLRIESAAAHAGAVRHLVHLLKYRGMETAGEVLAALMADRLPTGAVTLVPVPRAAFRRLRYGVDPARVLAERLSGLTGIPVALCLGAALWWPSHTGSTRSQRHAPSFRVLRPAPEGSVLVDDVLTTGATLVAAAQLAGCSHAITATRAETPRVG